MCIDGPSIADAGDEWTIDTARLALAAARFLSYRRGIMGACAGAIMPSAVGGLPCGICASAAEIDLTLR